jgi:peptidyl-prolyl cis-trans isomerase C
MRAMRFAVVAGTLLATGSFATAESWADGPPSGATDGSAAVVAEVGGARVVTVKQLEDRLAAVPPFQRATFGAGPDGIRRGFLEQVLVREELLALAGEAQGLASQPGTEYAVLRARSNGTLRAIRARIGPASSIPQSDVQKYYDANLARYDTPERYQIWRILCKTREEAVNVIEAAKKEPTPKKFGDLARDHSQDKTSYLRLGNLGFVTPDGTSSEPGWKVDEAVVRAVQSVRDGDIVATPVIEGDGFSVVWRHGSIPATKRTVDDAAAQIRDTLWKSRVKEETDKLVASLRASKVRDLNESLLDSIRFPSEGEAVTPRRRDAGP